MSRRRKQVLLFTAGAAIGAALALTIVSVVLLRSPWFERVVRGRMVYEIEHATGGRAEIGSFRFHWSTLTAEVAPFILHGTEPAGSPPLFRAASIRVRLRIVSLRSEERRV